MIPTLLLRLPRKASIMLSLIPLVPCKHFHIIPLVPCKHFHIIQKRGLSQFVKNICARELLSNFNNDHMLSPKPVCSVPNLRIADSPSGPNRLNTKFERSDQKSDDTGGVPRYILHSETMTEFKNRCQGQKFDMNEQDWHKLEDDVLRENPNAAKTLESTTMQLIYSSRDMGLSESFMTYIRCKGRPVKLTTLATFVAMCGICCGKQKQDIIFAAYEEMLEISDVFDHMTTRLLILGFSKTDRWRECLKFLEMTKLSKVPTTSFYCPVASAAFREGDAELGMSLLDHMAREGMVPRDEFLRDLVKISSDPEPSLDFRTLMGYLQKYHWIIEEDTARLIQEYFTGCADRKYSTRFTSVTDQGICRSCKQHLHRLKMSDGDFEILRRDLLHNVLIGDDVYMQSLPEELKRFMTFMQANARFDVVIDALNVVHRRVAGNFKGKRQFNFLQMVVRHFAVDRRQKVLVVGRKYMENKNTPNIERIAKTFYTEDASHDDLFVLYAALYSGNSCLIVSEDQMRDHKYKLGPHLKEMFELWQRLHQIPGVFPSYRREGLRVEMPIGHETGPQQDTGGWHIPYEDGKDRPKYQRSNMWLCVRDRGRKLH